jgi:single-strand DNA-binding protein
MNVNKAIICGRVTRDPEARITTSGATVVTFSIATNQHYTDKAGVKQEKTQFHNIVLWNKVAEIEAQYLTKGQECYIEGKMESRKYTDKEGIERKSFEIIGNMLQLGSKPKTQEFAGSDQYDNGAKSTEENIPTLDLDEEHRDVRIEDVPF